MVDNTAINGLRVPELTDPADITDAVGQLADDVDTRLFARFATPAARDAAITSPVGGMICWVASYNLPMVYYSSYWGFFPGTPIAAIYQSTLQACANSTVVAITMDAEEYDLTGGHDTVTNNTRFTPQIPGRYYFHGGMAWQGDARGLRSVQFRKNGTTYLRGPQTLLDACSTEATAMIAIGYGTFNGTTDYVELTGNQTSTVSLNTDVSDPARQPSFQVIYLGSS